jgi:hypothetical protein
LIKHLVPNGFIADYEMWVFHGKKYTSVATEESANDNAGAIGWIRCLKLYGQSLTWILRILMADMSGAGGRVL